MAMVMLPLIIFQMTSMNFLAMEMMTARAADGSGTMTVDDDDATARGAAQNFKFTFDPSEDMDGGAVKVTIPSGWPEPRADSGTDLDQDGEILVEEKNGADLDASDPEEDLDVTVLGREITINIQTMSASQYFTLKYHVAAIPAVIGDYEFTTESKLASGAFEDLSDSRQASVEVEPGVVASYIVTTPSGVKVGNDFDVTVTAKDADGNTTVGSSSVDLTAQVETGGTLSGVLDGDMTADTTGDGSDTVSLKYTKAQDSSNEIRIHAEKSSILGNSSYFQVAGLTAPTFSSPISSTNDSTPRVTWGAVSGSTVQYELNLKASGTCASASDVTSPLIHKTNGQLTTATSYQVADLEALLDETAYCIQVIATDVYGNHTEGYKSFNLLTSRPATPTSAEIELQGDATNFGHPVNTINIYNNSSVTVKVTRADSMTSGTVYAEVSDDLGHAVTGTATISGAGVVPVTGIDASSIKQAPSSEGTVRVRTRVEDSAGNSSNWSAYTTLAKDTSSPAQPSAVSFADSPVNIANQTTVDFNVTGESGANAYYTISSSGGGSATDASGNFNMTAGTTNSGNKDLTGLNDGTLTVSAYLVDSAWNHSSVKTGTTVTKDATNPTFEIQYYSDSGLAPATSLGDNPKLKAGIYYVKIISSETLSGAPTISIDAEGTNNDVTNATTTSVSGNNYTYTRTIASDGAAVGTAKENVSISGTDSYANAVTNVNPTNEASKVAYTDTTAPSGYSVTIGQPVINNTNQTAMSFTFAAAEVGATYNYSITTSGGAGTKTGTGTIATATDTISSIDVSAVQDGTLTLTVYLTDGALNQGANATATVTKDATAPAITDNYTNDGVWVRTDQTVTLTPTEADTVKYCEGASCDPTTGTTLVSPWSLSYSANQNTVVRYQAYDTAGNQSAVGEYNVKMDKTVPTSSGVAIVATETTSQTFDIPWTATDTAGTPESGVQGVKLYYSVNGGTDWTVYNGGHIYTASPISFVAPQAGTFNFYAMALDNAGNEMTAPSGGASIQDTIVAQPATVYVCPSGSCGHTAGWDDYSTIQSGINAIKEGASNTVNVAAGTYAENINVNKSLTLTGAGSGSVTVTAANAAVSVFSVTSNSVSISGFTVSGATGGGQAGIFIGAGVASCNISNNTLTGNYDGVWLGSGSNHNTLSSNTLSSNYQGFEVYISSNNTFTSNTANSNSNYGFKIDSGDHNTFTNNTANSNTQYGIRINGGSGYTLTGNTFNSNIIAGIRLKDNITTLSMQSNNITSNPIGIDIDSSVASVATWTISDKNNISGNFTRNVSNVAVAGTLNAESNWWGSNDDAVVASRISGSVDYLPFCTDATCDNTTNGIAPAAPVITGITTDSGSSSSDGITNDQTLLINGTAEANSTVTVYKNASSIGTTTADGSGNWSFDHTATTLSNGATYSFTATATDAATNVSGLSSAFSATIDTSAPATPVITSIAGDNYINNSEKGSVHVIGTAEAGSTVNVSLTSGATVTGSGTATGGNYDITLNTTTLTDGTVVPSVTATDVAGNVSGAAVTSTATQDTSAPATPVITSIAGDNYINNSEKGSVHVIGTAEAGSTVNVSLTSGATVSGSGTATGGNYDITLNTTTLTDGTVVPLVTATDAAGNISSAATTPTATQDTGTPVAPGVTLLDPINDANKGSVTLTLTGETGTTYNYSIDDSAIGSPVTGSGTLDVSPKDIAVDLTGLSDGTITATVTLTDSVGNVSGSGTDTAAKDVVPSIITITNPDTSPAQSKIVTASIDNGTLTMSINAAGVSTCDGTLTFIPYASTTFTAEADNTKTICYKAVDSALNISYSVSSAIGGIDRTAPTVVLSDDHAGSIVKNGETVLITATFTEADQIDESSAPRITISSDPALVSNVLMTKLGLDNKVWIYSWVVPTGHDGTHTVSILAHDRAGNANEAVTAAPGETTVYTIDNTAPTGTSVIIKGGDSYTTSADVTLTLAATDAWAPIKMKISNDGVFDSEVWEDFSSSKSWTLDGANGTKTVSVLFEDGGNNIISSAVTDTIILDTVAPSTPTGLVATPASWTPTNSFDLSWTNGADTSGIAGVYYKLDSEPTNNTDGTYVAGASITSLSSISVTGDGTHTIYVWLKDNAGLVDFVNRANTTLNYDATASSAPTVTSSTHPVEANWYNNNDPALDWNGLTDTSGIAGYSYILDHTADTNPDTTLEPAGTNKTYTDEADGTWYFHIKAKNGSGLWSGVTHRTIKIDTSTPSSSVTSTDYDKVGTISVNIATLVASPSGVQDVDLYARYDSNHDGDYTDTNEFDWTNQNLTPTANAVAGEFTFNPQDQDGWYQFYGRAENNAGTWEAEPVGNVADDSTIFDRTNPIDPTGFAVTSGAPYDTWTTQTATAISWTVSTDATSGLRGFSYKWDNSATADLPNNMSPTDGSTWVEDETVVTNSKTGMTDGLWYFHIQPRDNAENYGATTTYGPFKIDTTDPNISHSTVSSATAGVDIHISADVTDSDSGVKEVRVYYKHHGESSFTDHAMSCDGSWHCTYDIPDEENSDYEVKYYIKALDNANNDATDGNDSSPHTVSINPASATHFVFTYPTTGTRYAGTWFTTVIEARDQFNNVAEGFDGSGDKVNFTTNVAGVSAFAQVTGTSQSGAFDKGIWADKIQFGRDLVGAGTDISSIVLTASDTDASSRNGSVTMTTAGGDFGTGLVAGVENNGIGGGEDGSVEGDQAPTGDQGVLGDGAQNEVGAPAPAPWYRSLPFEIFVALIFGSTIWWWIRRRGVSGGAGGFSSFMFTTLKTAASRARMFLW